MAKILVLTDNLFVVERIKEIDFSYFILYDTKKKKYELHNANQYINTYCLTFPYDTLDERAVEFTKKTQSQNSKKLLEAIDLENEKLIQNERKKLINNTINKINN